MKKTLCMLAVLLLLPACGGKEESDTQPDIQDEITIVGAAEESDINKIKELLIKGEDPNTGEGVEERTALHCAAERGNKELVLLLLDYKADVDSPSGWIGTPLYRAVVNGHTDIAELLLAHGANVNASNNHDETLLHLAVVDGQADAVKFLILKGADIHARNEGGLTSLHYAAINNRTAIALLLISEGCDINAKAKDGETPLDMAESEEMKKLLRGYSTVSGDERREKAKDLGAMKFLLYKPRDVGEAQPGIRAFYLKVGKKYHYGLAYNAGGRPPKAGFPVTLIGRLPKQVIDLDFFMHEKCVLLGNQIEAHVKFVRYEGPLDKKDAQRVVYFVKELPRLEAGTYRVTVAFTDYRYKTEKSDYYPSSMSEPTFKPMTCEFTVPEK